MTLKNKKETGSVIEFLYANNENNYEILEEKEYMDYLKDILDELLNTSIINEKIEASIDKLIKENNIISEKEIIYKKIDEKIFNKTENKNSINEEENEPEINLKILESEIKGFIKYFIYTKNLKNEIECSRVPIYIKYYSKVYLINYYWLNKFNSFIYYLFGFFFNFIII